MHAQMTALVQSVQTTGDGLSVAEILMGIPHDAAAIFIYLLTAGVVGWVVWANRKRPKGPDSPAPGA